MAYFADLTDYAYGMLEPGLLNVGWLEVTQTFATGRTEKAFHDALAKCVCFPVNIYRGWHVCDLCEHHQTDDDQVRPYNLDGREIGGGNGEIRIHSVTGERFCAPTLVLHYVTCHEYKPPAQFIDAVMSTGPQLYVVAGTTLSRITQMSFVERYQTCVEVFRSASLLAGTPLTLLTYSDLSDLGNVFGRENVDRDLKTLLKLLEELEPREADSTLHLLWNCVRWFPLFFADPRYSNFPQTNALSIRRLVLSLEEGRRYGLAIDALESFVNAPAR